MALATSRDDLEAAGDVACLLMQAAELAGDLSPFTAWAPLVERYMFTHGHGALISFCGTCCGQVYETGGNWGEAEAVLLRTISALEERGLRPRCSHPAAALATLRVRQGRLEEAEELLTPYQDLPEAVAPRAEALLARRDPAGAVLLLEGRLQASGEDSLYSVPLLALLAEARAMLGDRAGGRATAARLEALAQASGLPRVEGLAALARARADDDPARARAAYESAVALLDNAHSRLDAAVARIGLARLLAAEESGRAVAEARAAADTFERMGARRLADEASALLRSLGVRGRTGPKGEARLTSREREVLDLLSRGLTNAEIADRLFISQKTAANHVSNVLMKLGVRSRTEAAVLARGA
jgi:DNA-binding NarL/FixJ family response regulator